MERVMGVEPTTFSLGSCEDPDVSGKIEEIKKTDFPSCTKSCTTQPDSSLNDDLSKIISAWSQLPHHIKEAILTLVKGCDD